MAARGRGPVPRWTNVFRLMDVQHKGIISAADALTIVDNVRRGKYFSEEQIAQAKVFGQEMFRQFINSGENTDGSVTVEQWLETGKKVFFGKPMSEAPEWWVDAMSKLFTLWNKDSNGVIPQEDFVTMITNMTTSLDRDFALNMYKSISNPLTKEMFLEQMWHWSSALVAVPADIYINVILRERADREKAEKERAEKEKADKEKEQ
eukprot:Phypoly_transcript_17555.p1 GENE.Phypoly_transcript_17555~~Phypoly_transcript_17555.p1  ORF type:complete len:206 (+),score=37.01 Phypoly_transcript_17555:95-712(+)